MSSARSFQFSLKTVFAIIAITSVVMARVSYLRRENDRKLSVLESLNAKCVSFEPAERSIVETWIYGDDKLRSATRVIFSDKVSADGIACLVGLSRLKSVCVLGVHVEPLALRHLARSNVEELYVTRTVISDDVAEDIAICTGLKLLDLEGTQITENAMKQLCRLPHLEILNIQSTSTSDSMMKHVASCSGLRQLNASNTQVTNAGVIELRNLSLLRDLMLDGNKVTDACVPIFSQLPKLTALSLNSTQVTDSGVVGIQQGCIRLEWLYLSDTDVSDASIEVICKMPRLYHLSINGSRVTPSGLVRLRQHPSLNYIQTGWLLHKHYGLQLQMPNVTLVD